MIIYKGYEARVKIKGDGRGVVDLLRFSVQARDIKVINPLYGHYRFVLNYIQMSVYSLGMKS